MQKQKQSISSEYCNNAFLKNRYNVACGNKGIAAH